MVACLRQLAASALLRETDGLKCLILVAVVDDLSHQALLECRHDREWHLGFDSALFPDGPYRAQSQHPIT